MQTQNEEAILAISKNQGIVLDRPKLVAFVTLDSRQRTFLDWAGDKQMSEALAAAGFIFKKEKGVLICFHCEIFVKVEEILSSGCDPWCIHIKKFPYCAHVRLCKGDTYVLEVLRGANIDHPTGDDDKIDSIIASNKTAYEAVIENYTDENLVRQAIGYLVCKKGQKKFTGFDLASVVEDLPNLLAADQRTVNAQSEVDEAIEDIDKLQEENDTLSERWKCKICFSGDACIITLPCGHMSSCPQCIAALTKCPMCRKVVKGTVRAMFARAAASCTP